MNEEEMQDQFLEQIREDQVLVEAAWKDLHSTGWNTGRVAVLIHFAHRLAGAALAAGYSDIGQTARSFETALKTTGAEPDWPVLKTRFADLKKAIADLKVDRATSQRIEQSIMNVSSLHETRSTGLVYIVDDDLAQAENLAAQVDRFGYKVRIFTQLVDLREGLRQKLPTAILMDIVFPEGELAGAEEIYHLRREFGEQLPVFFISVREDEIARIKAIRAGGKGYFPKPVDIDALTDEIDKLTVNVDPQPYRVMIVDDSEIQAKANALHLHKANMETVILTQALDILEHLENFRPDLLLLDLYMPECTGLELAQMIRQIRAYVSLPIVYLSAETDRDKQLAAIGQGGDDFLTKPIKPHHLISAVTSRIERYRQLQTLMLRDSLTGLFNHTTIREHLVREVTGATRKNQPLSLAMIDIDLFKDVNDSYGHATGDKVLRSFSHMLSRRLRRSDIIGRYGGDEFIVILPNTEKRVAWALMNELCESFSQIVHISKGMEFRVTFSCGIAAFPEQESPSALSEVADKALYAAKRQGRNGVSLAE